MANEARPIIVKRIKKVTGGHHGGAWKIAYADFVTAMMAFFLLMWLLGSTAKGDLNGIAEYFRTPLKVALQGGSGSGDSSSITRGGGQDLTRADGQVRRGDKPAERRTINLQAAKAELERQETARLTKLKESVEAALDGNPRLGAVRDQIRLDLTDEGLRIQIVDAQNRPMFDTGSAHLKDYTREILRQVAAVLNQVENRIGLSGHTDAAPYSGGERGYSNWELSADRANASRRELLAAGLADDKVLRVVGLAASIPFGAEGPLHPSNRRISIVVLNKLAEQALRSGGKAAEAQAEPAVPRRAPEQPAN
jgi:chemotaxis protein MotB